MTACQCTGVPVSWLALEQYRLGELPEDRQVEVERHLRNCSDCAAAVNEIINDSIVLKPLPVIIPQPAVRRFPRRIKPVMAVVAPALAAVALVALSLGVFRTPQPSVPAAAMVWKGGELAVSLVRERDGQVSHDPDGFLDGDRFRVEVTCPPGDRDVDVAVFQGDAVHFPLDPVRLVCGNRIPVPGAMALSGADPVIVCVVVDDPPTRSRLHRDGLSALPGSAVCRVLAPLE
jgi:anti-sigma factor RsiW